MRMAASPPSRHARTSACLSRRHVSLQVLFGFFFVFGREAIARYGTCMGGFNTGADIDFPIRRSTVTTSAVSYSGEGSGAVVYGEHRDLAFAQLKAALVQRKPAPAPAPASAPTAAVPVLTTAM